MSEYVYIFEGEHKGTRGRITSAIDKGLYGVRVRVRVRVMRA